MNMQAIMRQAQTLQKDMMKTKEEIDKTIFTGSNSFVTVKVNGKKEVIEIKIDDSVELSKEDLEMLQDVLLLAINDAMKKVDAETEKRMSKYSNLMPGIF